MPTKIPEPWAPAVLLQERAESLSKDFGLPLGDAVEIIEADDARRQRKIETARARAARAKLARVAPTLLSAMRRIAGATRAAAPGESAADVLVKIRKIADAAIDEADK